VQKTHRQNAEVPDDSSDEIGGEEGKQKNQQIPDALSARIPCSW
jgi:hypothetical protein